MAKEKIDQVLEEIRSLTEGQQSLQVDVQSLKEGQQTLTANYQALTEGQQSLQESVRSLTEGQRTLTANVQTLQEGQQKNYVLIQKNGVRLEKLDSDIKAVAEGHGVIRNEMKQMEERLTEKISLVDGKVEFLGAEVRIIKTDLKEVKGKVNKIDRALEEHVRLPAHM